MITLFEPNIERLTDKQLEIVILHELMHVGIEHDGNEEIYYIKQHDVEDFRTIIDRYGLDWSLDEQT
jgi:predicted metallopeptidase